MEPLRIAKRCEGCGTWAEGLDDIEANFEKKKSSWKNSSTKYETYDPKCYFCRQDERLEYQRKHPWKVKAKNTIQTHWPKFKKRGWLRVRHEIETLYGWSVKAIADLFELACNRKYCPNCGYAFSDMPGDSHEMTIDIINPDQRPWLNGNVRVICRSCNNAKSRMPLGKFNFRNNFGNRRRKRLENRKRWKQEKLF